MRLYILLAILFHAQYGIAQNYHSEIRNAEKAYDKGNYCKATKLFEEVVENDPENLYAHYRLGHTYTHLNKYEEAVNHYEEAAPLMKDSMQYQLEMYHLYSRVGLQSFAKQSFIKYVNLCPSCVKGDLLPGMMSNKLLYKQPIREPKLMGYEGGKAEYYPYIINDNSIQHLRSFQDKSLPTRPKCFRGYMTTNYTNTDHLFYNTNNFNQKNKGEGFKYGPFTLNKSLTKIYMTRWDYEANRLLIYHALVDSSKGAKSWKAFKRVEIDLEDNESDFIHPMFTKDEKHLIYSSNVKGGLGGYDLWIGEIAKDGKIVNSKNLGTYVNTPRDEVFPSVYDNDVIFFASDGHYGYGGLDLYAGIKSKEKYRKTYNLGNRFNSSYDDYSLFYHTKSAKGYFSSNRYLNEIDSMPFDRIYSQGFDKIATTFFIEDQNGGYASGVNINVPSENIKLQSNADGKAYGNINPLGYKKVVISGDKYYTKDTLISPFEPKVNIRVTKKSPTDNVSFSLLSHPYENPAAGAYYILTSQSDKSKICSMADGAGIGNVTVYGDELYDISVPSYNYEKKGVSFKNQINAPKFYVWEDKVVSESKSVKTNKKSEEVPVLSDQLTLYYESGQAYNTENLNRQIQHIVQILNQNPGYKLELLAHTDCQGDKMMNLQLSKIRMEEAKKLFFSRGVAESQIIGKFFGENMPTNTCRCDDNDNYSCSSDLMRLNRRTEVRIIK